MKKSNQFYGENHIHGDIVWWEWIPGSKPNIINLKYFESRKSLKQYFLSTKIAIGLFFLLITTLTVLHRL